MEQLGEFRQRVRALPKRISGELAAAGLLENKAVSRFQFYFNRPLLKLLNQL